MARYIYNPFTNNLDAVSSSSVEGTITAVGDVTSGAAFTGTQGTELTSTSAGFTIQVQAVGASSDTNGGDVNLIAGLGGTLTNSGTAGNVNLFGSDASAGNQGGNINLLPGVGGTTGVGGDVNLTGGSGGATSGTGGDVVLTSGSPSSGTTNQSAGQVLLQAANHTGNALPALMRINGTTYSDTSSTTASVGVDRIVTNCCNPYLENGVAHNIVGWTILSPWTMAAGTIIYQAEVYETGQSNAQVCTGKINFVSTFDSISGCVGTVQAVETEISSCTAGTLSTSWTFTNIDSSGFAECTVNSTGLSGIAYIAMYYTLITNSQTHIAVLTS